MWVMEFSVCGRLLATAGQDSVVVRMSTPCVYSLMACVCRECGCCGQPTCSSMSSRPSIKDLEYIHQWTVSVRRPV